MGNRAVVNHMVSCNGTLSEVDGTEQILKINYLKSILGKKHPEYEIYPNLASFWNPKKVISDWKWGCMFVCAAWKLKLLHGKNRLNEQNFDRLLLANGADAHTVSALVDVFRLCKRRWLRNVNSCDLWARVTGCIRDAIIGYGWMPDY